jgi:hypothetical protein
MDRQYRIIAANESFQNWLAETAETAEERVAELLAELEISEVPNAPNTVYSHLWHSNYSDIRAQIWHRYNDNHNIGELGEFAQGDLYVYALRRNNKLVIWFQCEWEPSSDLAEEMVEDIAWDDYDLYLSDVRDNEELADALADLLTTVHFSEAQKTDNPERLQLLFDQEKSELDWALSGNPAIPAEMLLKLEARYANKPENKNIVIQSRENPNYPEDKTEWALGDW